MSRATDVVATNLSGPRTRKAFCRATKPDPNTNRIYNEAPFTDIHTVLGPPSRATKPDPNTNQIYNEVAEHRLPIFTRFEAGSVRVWIINEQTAREW